MATALTKLRSVVAKRRIAAVTAWDYPSGLLADTAGIDLVLVGDSLGMSALGHPDTKAVTLQEMVHHTRAVSRATKSCFVLADLCLGSYEKSTEHAIESAIRLVKEGGAHGVKLEGGSEMSATIRAISRAGVPVVGHIGMTLQRNNDVSVLEDKDEDESQGESVGVFADAKSVQDAGAVAVLLEAVAPDVAARITNSLRIPTIGIGSGPNCSGQMALQTDILGFQTPLFPEWHKRYANIGDISMQALQSFSKEVQEEKFPV